jgi:signal transduction histidine kinase
VLFEVRPDGDATLFRVADQGIGIPPDEISHLFESFHRASNVGDIQGTGLGLAIVKNAVEIHGGTIAVESRLGAGTTFTVRLPGSPPARG